MPRAAGNSLQLQLAPARLELAAQGHCASESLRHNLACRNRA